MSDLINVDSTVNDLMAMADMPKDQIKRAMDQNYLSNLVRQHPTLDKSQIVEFINKCQLTGADPRLNQVYLLVHNAWNKDKQKEEPKGTTVFAYQFFIQMAQRTGELEDFGVDTVHDTYLDLVTGKEKKSITAIAWVNRKGKGKTTYKGRFWEFAKTMKSGDLMGSWKTMPYLMLEKCAVANVMRWAFPEALTGLYVAEEIDKDSPPPPKPVQAPRVEISAPQQVAVEPLPEPSNIVPDGAFEDLKADTLDFINTRPEVWFKTLGKLKGNVVSVIEKEQTYPGMLSLQSMIEALDKKYQAMQEPYAPPKQ